MNGVWDQEYLTDDGTIFCVGLLCFFMVGVGIGLNGVSMGFKEDAVSVAILVFNVGEYVVEVFELLADGKCVGDDVGELDGMDVGGITGDGIGEIDGWLHRNGSL